MNWKTICLVTLLPLAGQLNAQHGLHISGFVDASITVPTDSLTNLGFSFDAVDVDVEKELAKGVSVRADLDFFQEHGHPVAEVEQAFVSFKLFNVKGVATPVITFGQFNAPIGFELLDAPDMYQYSHSLVFKRGWLVMLNYGIGDFGITVRQDAWGKSSSTTFSPSYGIADGAGMLF